MAYSGYLVKIGSYTVPFAYIQYNTYSAVWSVNDMDSYRDANGELHRTALSRRTLKVEWEVPPMDNVKMAVLMSAIRGQFTNNKEKKCTVTAYIPELNDYKTETCYLTSDVNFSIRFANADKIEYNPTRLAFIGYVTSSASD